MRQLAAETIKLATTRLYVGFLVAAVALVVVVTGLQFALGDDTRLGIEGAATVVQTDEDLRSVLNVAGVAAVFGLVLGALAVAGEFRHGTIVATFLAEPRRERVVVTKMAVYFVAGVLFGIVVEVAAVTVAAGWLVATGATVPIGGSVLVGLALDPLAVGLASAFGVGVGAGVPNQLGAVLVVLGWVMVAEQLIGGLLPQVTGWLPFNGANTAISGRHPELGAWGGLGLFLLYLLVVSWLGMHMIRRRDVA